MFCRGAAAPLRRNANRDKNPTRLSRASQTNQVMFKPTSPFHSRGAAFAAILAGIRTRGSRASHRCGTVLESHQLPHFKLELLASSTRQLKATLCRPERSRKLLLELILRLGFKPVIVTRVKKVGESRKRFRFLKHSDLAFWF